MPRPQDALKTTEARYIHPETQEVTLVQPNIQGKRLRPGRVPYDEAVHAGHLHCMYCSLKVLFNQGAKTTGAGNRNGPSPHFEKERGGNHEQDCPMLKIEANVRAKEEAKAAADKLNPPELKVKPELSPRLHINHPDLIEEHMAMTIEDPARHKNPIYAFGGDSKSRIVHPDLIGREHFGAEDAKRMVKFMKETSPDRLKEVPVVINWSICPWPLFMIPVPQGKRGQPRLHGLIDRLNRGSAHPCLMQIHLESHNNKYNPLMPKRIFLEREKIEGSDDRLHYVQQRLYFDSSFDKRSLKDIFSKAGSYLILGIPSHEVVVHAKNTIHMIDFKLTSPDQIVACDLDDLAYEVRTKAGQKAPLHKGRQMGLELHL